MIEGKVSLAAAREDYGVVLAPAAGSAAFTHRRGGDGGAARKSSKPARTSEPPMIDRGAGFEKMLRGEVKPWTRSA